MITMQTKSFAGCLCPWRSVASARVWTGEKVEKRSHSTCRREYTSPGPSGSRNLGKAGRGHTVHTGERVHFAWTIEEKKPR